MMNWKNFKRFNGMLVTLLIALGSAQTLGHMQLDAPNGGEALTAGEIYPGFPI